MIQRFFAAVIFMCIVVFAQASEYSNVQQQQETHQGVEHESEDHGGHHETIKPANWSVIPFVLLLVMIATGPLFYPHFWHKSYPVISIVLAFIVCTYYIFFLHNDHSPVHSAAEYIQFIALLSGLFVASGGILINVDKDARPLTNVIILAFGALIANIIGTTGASMLLIRPFIRLNKNRIKPYHIVFFIFIVSNVGGSLTPIGDPPLFLGFLKGIPFEWTVIHNLVPWAIACILLLTFFYLFDIRNKTNYALMRGDEDELEPPTGKVTLVGKKN
ncbi:MAG: sodium:proton antiporter, partial [Ekhidna sp.]|nr:sodium:proton antiporter [Ekhidna sp.]